MATQTLLIVCAFALCFSCKETKQPDNTPQPPESTSQSTESVMVNAAKLQAENTKLGKDKPKKPPESTPKPPESTPKPPEKPQNQSEGEPCAKPDDCAPLLRCVELICVSQATIKCKASDDCSEYGKCTAKDGKCIATSDADCKASDNCKDMGQCTAGKDGYCQATLDADCKASEACTRHGKCNTQNHKCMATSNADCKASEDCEYYGECIAKDGKCRATSDKQAERLLTMPQVFRQDKPDFLVNNRNGTSIVMGLHGKHYQTESWERTVIQWDIRAVIKGKGRAVKSTLWIEHAADTDLIEFDALGVPNCKGKRLTRLSDDWNLDWKHCITKGPLEKSKRQKLLSRNGYGEWHELEGTNEWVSPTQARLTRQKRKLKVSPAGSAPVRVRAKEVVCGVKWLTNSSVFVALLCPKEEPEDYDGPGPESFVQTVRPVFLKAGIKK